MEKEIKYRLKDRVRIIKDEQDANSEYVGKCGTIVEIRTNDYDGHYPYRVLIDGYDDCTNDYCSDELELCKKTLETEFGEKVGSVQWALELYKQENVIPEHDLTELSKVEYGTFYYINDISEKEEPVPLHNEYFNGWHRKPITEPTPKGELIDFLNKNKHYGHSGSEDEAVVDFIKIYDELKNYNITKKEDKE